MVHGLNFFERKSVLAHLHNHVMHCISLCTYSLWVFVFIFVCLCLVYVCLCLFDLFFVIKSCSLKLKRIYGCLNLIAIRIHFLGISSFSFSCDVCTTFPTLEFFALVICVWTLLVYVLWEKDNVHDVFTLLGTCLLLTSSFK